MNYSTLYKRDTYINKDIPFIYGKDIYEYDIHHAGISISRYFNLLPEEELDRIEKKAKNKKEIAVILGKLQRKDSKFKENLKKGFEDARELFFKENQLQDNEILSIKKDAIFTLCPCTKTDFGDIVFVNKNHYTSYARIGMLEFYYAYDKLDVKGISDEKLYEHQDHILKFINKVFYLMENDSIVHTLQYIRVFSDRYKRLELDPEYYRSFDREGVYRTKDGEYTYSFVTPDLLPTMDISYNYVVIICGFLTTIL